MTMPLLPMVLLGALYATAGSDPCFCRRAKNNFTSVMDRYSKHGFVLDSCDSFVHLTLAPLMLREEVVFTKKHANVGRDLPPFGW